jgi:4-amino-4-deoxy-L-arabinose transferase-like glycosyltransferase
MKPNISRVFECLLGFAIALPNLPILVFLSFFLSFSAPSASLRLKRKIYNHYKPTMNISNFLLLLNRFPRSSLILITLPLLLLNSHQQSLLAHDEGYYAVQARWIWETGDWLTPQWWGKPIYDRTIGIQWLIALSYHLFGLNEFSVRLPSAIACIASVLLTYEIGKILFNQQIAWLGGVILMLMGIWVSEAHTAQQNTALVAIELLGILALLKVTEFRTSNSVSLSRNRRWGVIAGAAVGWGFIIKAFMIFVPIVALFPYFISRHRYHKLLSNPGIYIGLIIGAIPTGLWLLLSYQKYGMMPIQDLVNKLLFLSKADMYDPGPFYYLWNLPANIFPWALFSAIGAIVVGRKLLPDLNYSGLSLTLGYPIFLFVLLSSFKTRMPYYTLQLLPFMALFAATAFIKFTQIGRHRSSPWYRLMTALSYAFSGLGILLTIAAIIVIIERPLLGITIPPEIRTYALPALILGCGWGSIPFLWHRWQSPSMPYWLVSWLAPVWFTLVTIGLQGSLADRTPDFMTAFQQPKIQQALNSSSRQPVHILSDTVENDGFKGSGSQTHFLTGEEHKTLVLLSFYTPQLGKQIPTFAALPDRSYAWTLSKSAQLATKSRTIGTVQGWKLIQKL